MDDFFQLLYEHGLSSGALNPDLDPAYRRAYYELDQLPTALFPNQAEREPLQHAILNLVDYSDMICLGYGFRLAARILG